MTDEYDDLRDRIWPAKLVSGLDLDELENLRRRGHDLGMMILDTLGPSRERSLALTHLEETLHWAQRALERERGAV